MTKAMLRVHITTEVRDKDGKLLYRKRRRSRSFVYGFLAILAEQMSYAGLSTALTDIGGTARTLVGGYATNLDQSAAAADATNGVVVGSGSTAATNTDTKLATQIVHGTGSGQLTHSAVTITKAAAAGSSTTMTIWRDFTNNTAGSITVWEEGLYGKGWDATAGRDFCIVRDVESSGISVVAGANLRVTYTIQTTV